MKITKLLPLATLSILLATLSCTNRESAMEKLENETLTTIHARSSVRSYSDKPVSTATLETLVKAAMAAPTGKDRRPWHFIIITDRPTLDTLAAKLPYAKMLTDAPAAIVVCGSDDEKTGSPYWWLDCSAASQNLLLAAQSLGLGAVWTTTYPYPERMEPVSSILDLPSEIHPLNVIPVGYPSKDSKPKDKFDPSRIHRNKW